MMRKAILDFAKQFAYEPKVENLGAFRAAKKFVVCGMGGSHLAADLLRTIQPGLDILIHRDYGLPVLSAEEFGERLIILSSYSGNTEEVIDGFAAARAKKLNMIVIAIGGKLIDLARQYSLPYIQMPDTGIQPRSALGFSFLALLKAMGEERLLQDAARLTQALKPAEFEAAGRALAVKTKGHVPVIYASTRNLSVAYNWKIKLNETGKIPAFYNVLPELNHNEMTGFDVQDSTRSLSERFYFFFLKDADDHPSIRKRFSVLEKLYKERGLPLEAVALTGGNVLEKVFASLLLADWFAVYSGEGYGLETEEVPMVEEFKKLIR